MANHPRTSSGARLATAGLLLACFAAAACGDDICSDVQSEIGLVCTPDTAAAGIPLKLDIREACGVNEARGQTCTAVLLNGSVVLALHEDHCNVGTSVSDNGACSRNIVPCQLPALGPGDYPLVFAGGPGQVLRVRPGGAPNCRLPTPPPAP